MNDQQKNGGPAFPGPGRQLESVRNLVSAAPGMSPGMSLRDYFAGQALVGMSTVKGISHEVLAAVCYRMADRMLEARKVTS